MFTRGIDTGLLILRLGFGGLMLFSHGWPKLMKLIDGNMKFGDPLGVGPEVSLVLAVLAEVVCALLVVLGLFTRVATVPLIITMAVAAFIVHGDDPFNKIEFALIYLLGFLALFFTGPGEYSIDANRRRGMA